jgi:hypothetical protein
MQAGGHLNQQPLVRQEPAGRAYQQTPAVQPQGRPAQSSQPSQGFHSFGQTQVKQTQSAPRVYEQQGTPPAENQNEPQTRAAQPAPRNAGAPAQSHPLVRPAPPVQERSPQQERQQEQKFSTWQQQRPAPAPAAQPKENSRPPAPAPAPKEEKPAKK